MKHPFIFAVIVMMISSCGNTKETSGYKDLATVSEHTAETSGSRSAADDQQQQHEAGQITAAEWNDLAEWNFWQSLNQRPQFSEMHTYWNYDFNNRIALHITNNTSQNLVDVPVELLTEQGEVLWKAKTDHKGNAELWPSLKSGREYDVKTLQVKAAGRIFNNLVGYENKEVNKLVLADSENDNSHEKKIDIAFMVDATGSMGDELEFLKSELADVIDKVKAGNAQLNVQTGTVFYRDHGENYVTKKSGFTSNIHETVSFIKEQLADGGGDFPEAVEDALSESVLELQWSSDAITRILFIVLDAPPHHDEAITSKINHLVELAAAKGIVIIPVTASGIDKETEFLMRYMAIATNGSYVFITNDSGIGNEHLEASVGNYQVEYLNKLMVRLINERL